jgi:hypothetical protein
MAGCISWTRDGGSALLSGYSKKAQLLGAIIGPSVGCGIFVMLDLQYLSENRFVSAVLILVLAGACLSIAISGGLRLTKHLSADLACPKTAEASVSEI